MIANASFSIFSKDSCQFIKLKAEASTVIIKRQNEYVLWDFLYAIGSLIDFEEQHWMF